jgi:hypothetical protein
VGFRGLTLDQVRLPHDVEHLLIMNFALALDKMVDALKQQEDSTARKLIAFLIIRRKWAVLNQVQGIINIRDLADVVGEEGVQRLVSVVPK